MIVNWLIVDIGSKERLELVAAEVIAQGGRAELVSLKQAYGLENLPFTKEELVFPYGPVLCCQHLTEQMGWTSWINKGAVKCNQFYPLVGDVLVNNDYCIVPAGDVMRLWDELRHYLGEESDQLFVRPNENTKRFTGIKTDSYEARKLFRAIETDELVVVSSPKEVLEEYRIFFHKMELIAWTQYKPEKNRRTPAAVLKFAEGIARIPEIQNLMPPVFIIDVGSYAYEGKERLGVLEMSGVSCAGFYEADVSPIVKAVNHEILELASGT